MKLQLFINGNLFKERVIYDKDLHETNTKSKVDVDHRKERITWYVNNLKQKFITDIYNANYYEIRLSVESKMNKKTTWKELIEQKHLVKLENGEKNIAEIKPISKPIIFERPKAEYSNKGYLSLTGS